MKSKIEELYIKTHNLRCMIYDHDIPSPTIPDYIKRHELFSSYMKYMINQIFPLFHTSYGNNGRKFNIENLDKFLKDYYDKITELRSLMFNNDVRNPRNPEQAEYHGIVIEFVNFITSDILPILEEIKEEQ